MAQKPLQLKPEECSRLYDYLREQVSLSRGQTQTYLDNVERWRNHLKDRDESDEEMYKDASLLRSPYVKETILSMMGGIVPSLLNVEPVLHLEGLYSPWDEVADELEGMYQDLLMRHMRFRPTFEHFIYNGLRDGTGVAMVTYCTKQARVWGFEESEEPEYDEAGNLIGINVVRKPTRQYTTTYDGPRVDVIPVDRFGVFPAHASHVQESSGCYVRFTATGQDIMQRTVAGYYDQQAVSQLLERVTGTEDQTTPQEKLLGVSSSQLDRGGRTERQNGVYYLTECYFRYAPSAGKPAEEWLMTMDEESNTVLRCIPSPFNKRPFVIWRPYSPFEGVYGESVDSMGAGHVQEAKTQLERLAINTMKRRLNRRVFVPQSQYEAVKKTFGSLPYKEDGAIIPLPDHAFAQGKLLLPIEDGVDPNSIVPLLDYLDQQAQKGTGVNDQDKAAALPNVTATVAQLADEANRKRDGLVLDAAADALREIGEMIHELVKQYSDRESMQKLWALNAGQTGLTLEQALEGEYEFSANGTAESSNKALQAQRAMDMNGLLQNEQEVMMDPKRRYKLRHYTLQKLGFRTPEDFIGTEEEWVQNAMMQQQQAAIQQQAQQEQQAMAMQAKQQSDQQRNEIAAMQAMSKMGLA